MRIIGASSLPRGCESAPASVVESAMKVAACLGPGLGGRWWCGRAARMATCRLGHDVCGRRALAVAWRGEPRGRESWLRNHLDSAVHPAVRCGPRCALRRGRTKKRRRSP